MYKEATTRVNNVCGKTEDLSVGVGQGLALSLFLFSLLVDAIKKDIIYDEVKWCMMLC